MYVDSGWVAWLDIQFKCCRPVADLDSQNFPDSHKTLPHGERNWIRISHPGLTVSFKDAKRGLLGLIGDMLARPIACIHPLIV